MGPVFTYKDSLKDNLRSPFILYPNLNLVCRALLLWQYDWLAMDCHFQKRFTVPKINSYSNLKTGFSWNLNSKVHPFILSITYCPTKMSIKKYQEDQGTNSLFFHQRNYCTALITQHGDMSYDVSKATCMWKEILVFVDKLNYNPSHHIFTWLFCRCCLRLQCDMMVWWQGNVSW